MTSVPHIGRILHPTYCVNTIVEAGTLRAAIQPVLLNFSVLVHTLERVDEEVHVAVDVKSALFWPIRAQD